MGPYCKFCGTRCFVPVTERDAAHVRAVYQANGLDLGATCQAGIGYEEGLLGVSLAAARHGGAHGA